MTENGCNKGYSEFVESSSAMKLASAYERGAKDRMRDALRREPSDGIPLSELPPAEIQAYIEGWLDAFKAELRYSKLNNKLKGVPHVNDFNS